MQHRSDKISGSDFPLMFYCSSGKNKNLPALAVGRLGQGVELVGAHAARHGASSYEQKYYFNQDFASLPETVKQELQIMCVLFTEDVGGILTLEFDEDGSLQFKTEALEADARFDEIGSALKIKELQRDKRELLESLEMYYKVFFLGDIPDEELQKKADAVEE